MSIFLRYSPVSVTLSRPFELPSSRDQDGNLKVVSFPNQWGGVISSFATSGFVTLASVSGIILNTPGYVDASGIRVNTIFAQNYKRIDQNGNITDLYPDPTGGLLYKQDGDTVGVLSTFKYDSTVQDLISVEGNPGSPLYVEPSLTEDAADATKKVTTFDNIVYTPSKTLGTSPPTVIPAEIEITDAKLITDEIQIGNYGDPFKNTILTHQGANKPAAWVKAEYLKADAVSWIRYPKRAIIIEHDRIYFFEDKPDWALIGDANDYVGFDIDKLKEEFQPADTIALIEANTLDEFYVKASVSVSYLFIEQDPNLSTDEYVRSATFTDEDGTHSGFVMEVCPRGAGTQMPAEGVQVKGYAYSVKRGAYLTMQLAPDATDSYSCNTTGGATTFKPSTVNTISIRPTIHTSFNGVAEDIDFIIFGQKKTRYDNYDSAFDLDSSRVPVGLTAGFKLDANIPNAVVGTLARGVTFTKFVDRNKTQPTGYTVDETPKITINRNNAYAIDTIPSGSTSLSYYASLSVSGVTYSDEILTKGIYLTPKPTKDGAGEYVANALLTIDPSGKIVSRKPATNPTVPSKPTVSFQVQGNDEVSLSWSEPNNGGKPIVNYVVEFSANNGIDWTEVPSGQLLRGLNTQTACTVKDLSYGVFYQFRVKAVNAVGYSEASTSTPKYVPNYNLAQTVRNLVGNRSFGDSLSNIELFWDAPASEGTSEVSGYIIEESDNYGYTWIFHNSYESLIEEPTSETIYGLQNDKDYLYRLTTINGSGYSTYNYIYFSGNVIPETEADNLDINWDFGVILFTGVCSS